MEKKSADIPTETTQPEAVLAVPQIAIVIAEKLLELPADKKESTAFILKDIVGAVHGAHLLEERGTDSEKLGAVVSKLEELCAELFESIGIDYAEEDIKEFVRVLLRPEFYPPNTILAQSFAEGVGTHEVKRFFRELPADLIKVEDQLQRLLGRLVVYHASKTTEDFELAA